jgi:hypothetical protein
MNLTVNTHSSTWKNARNRYVIGIGGVALAITVAIGGISALPDSGSRQASVTPQAERQSRPSTLYPTAADAALAVLGDITVGPQFGSISDAHEAAIALGFADAEARAGTPDVFYGLGQPGERAAFAVPQFANTVDAWEASVVGVIAEIGAPDSVAPFSGTLGSNEYSGMEVAEIPAPATTAPQFASMADTVEALWYLEVQQVSVAPTLAQPVSPSTDSPDAYLGLGQPGERSAIPQLFSNYVDAWEASIRQ